MHVCVSVYLHAVWVCVCTCVGVCVHAHVCSVYTCLHKIHKHGYFKNYYTMYYGTYTFVWIFGPTLSTICIVQLIFVWILFHHMNYTCTIVIIQDILSGTDLNKMVSLVEMMIENHAELFEVPQQVQVPAREYIKKKRSGEVRCYDRIKVYL